MIWRTVNSAVNLVRSFHWIVGSIDSHSAALSSLLARQRIESIKAAQRAAGERRPINYGSVRILKATRTESFRNLPTYGHYQQSIC